MTGAYAYTPDIWPPLVAAIFLAAIGLYAWRRRAVPGGKPFVAMSAVSILLLLGIAFEAAAVVPATKIAWYELQFVLLLAGTTPVTCFVLDYAYPGRWLTRRNVFLLSIPPLLCLLMALINDSQLIWRRLEIGADGSVVLTYAPGGALLVAYGLALFLLYTAVFLRLFIRSPQHRWPVALMLLGQISSRAVFLIDNARLPALSTLDLSVLVIVLPWTTYAVALFGFRILDPLPAARSDRARTDAGWDGGPRCGRAHHMPESHGSKRSRDLGRTSPAARPWRRFCRRSPILPGVSPTGPPALPRSTRARDPKRAAMRWRCPCSRTFVAR